MTTFYMMRQKLRIKEKREGATNINKFAFNLCISLKGRENNECLLLLLFSDADEWDCVKWHLLRVCDMQIILNKPLIW